MAAKAVLPAWWAAMIKNHSRVAVVGDGNAAFDLARTLVRQGKEVTLLSWFPENLIPADPHEVRGELRMKGSPF